MRWTIGSVVVLCVLCTSGPAAARVTVGQVMREVTPLLSLGHRDDGLPLAEQVRRVNKGKPLRVTCGYAAWIVGEILERKGYAYRRVVMVPDELEGAGTHTIIEVKQRRGWTLYDPLYGVKPLVNGKPTNVEDYTRDRRPSRFVAFKPLDLPDVYERWRRGIGLIEDGPGLYHRYKKRAAELGDFSSGWYRWIPRREFLQRFYG